MSEEKVEKTEEVTLGSKWFRHGNVESRQGLIYTKTEFMDKFKGRLKVDIDEAWKEYAKFKKKHK